MANVSPGVAIRIGASEADIARAVATVIEHDWFAAFRKGTASFGHYDTPVPEGLVSVRVEGQGQDWLSGYATTLDALAHTLEFSPCERDPRVIAVVGLLVDRLEADRMADVAEIKRMLKGVGFEEVLVWPGDGPIDIAKRISAASVVVSLPYGRQVARTIAERTGAALIETALPMGFAGSIAWLQAIADAAEMRAMADAFISAELDRLIPRFEWAIPHGLLHKRLAFIGDPFFAAAFYNFATELGCDVAALLPTAYAAMPDGLPGPDALFTGSDFDLVIASTRGVEALAEHGLPFLEMGFPSIGAHALYPLPYLGLEGVPRLAELIMNRIALFEVFKSIKRDYGPKEGPEGDTNRPAF